jgi:hypothetical protein
MSERRTTPRGVPREGDEVTASEVAAYAYCAKAWHLEYVLGYRPSGDALRHRAAGEEHHAAHGAALARRQPSHRRGPWLALVLFILAAVLLAMAFLAGGR